MSFGPRNSSIGLCENLSLILDLRFTVDAGLIGVVSYRKTLFSLSISLGKVICVSHKARLLLNIVFWIENYKM